MIQKYLPTKSYCFVLINFGNFPQFYKVVRNFIFNPEHVSLKSIPITNITKTCTDLNAPKTLTILSCNVTKENWFMTVNNQHTVIKVGTQVRSSIIYVFVGGTLIIYFEGKLDK